MALSKLLSSNPLSWTSFYERNRNDGGGVERLFEAGLATLSIITTSHLKKPDKLVETIAGSTYSNMIMVAGEEEGVVHVLHHGFVNATSFGGEASILFLSGNSSEAPLKALAHASAVLPIKSGPGRTRGAPHLDAPTFHDMLNTDSETDFANLRSNGNNILRNKPNHMMIGPAVFLLAEGAQRIRAKTLAYQIINRLRDDVDNSSTGNDTIRNDRAPDPTPVANDDNKEGTDTPLPPSSSNTTRDNFIELLDSRNRGISQMNEDDDQGFSVEVQRTRGGGPTTHDELDTTTDDIGDDVAYSVTGDAPIEDTEHIEHLLAWLWACEKKMVPAARTSDPIYDSPLVSRLRNIRSKLTNVHTDETATTRTPAGRADSAIDRRNQRGPVGSASSTVARNSSLHHNDSIGTNDGLSDLALTTKEIANVLERMETNRRQEHNKQENDKSFLRNVGTMQRKLFTALCTDELGEIPEHPTFLKNLMETKTPQKAIAMIRSEIWEWEGSFFDGPFHRFLANGYLSRDGNKGSPGGFTLFMFCPKNVEASLNTNKSDIALLRDYFGLDVDDDTVNHYAKQGWFYPSNHYDLRVQLKTACAMIDLLTGEGSIAAQGLSYILSPTRWDRYAPLLAERFKTENLFGAKFVYCLDRNLQVFFAKLSKWSADEPHSLDPNYLRNKAEGLLDKIDDGNTLGIILPTTIYGPAGAKRALELDAVGGDVSPSKRGKTSSPNKQITFAPTTHRSGHSVTPLTTAALLESAEMRNDKTIAEWLLPNGTQYYDFFLSKDRSTRGWPLLDDPRITTGPAPMCIRYQTIGKCREACRMAHVSADSMTADNRKRIGDRLKEAYGRRGTSS